METQDIRKAGSGNNNGFKLSCKVVEITAYDEKPALRVQQLSGANAGRELIVVQEDNPSYKGVKFDPEGLSSLKIKKGTNVGLSGAKYLSSDDKTTPVVEVRRAAKIGKDYRPEQTLAITSYAANIKNLNGYVLTEKQGVHATVTDDKQKVVAGMVNDVLGKLTDTQGIMLLVNTKKSDGSAITVQKSLSRYQKDTPESTARLLSADEFKTKVLEFLANPDSEVMNFSGLVSGKLASALAKKDAIKVAVVPCESIFLTGHKHFNDRLAVEAGIGKVGLAIDPGNDEREYPIMQIAAMEMTDLLGLRWKGLNGESFGGDRVRQMNEDFLFQRLVGHIEMLNGRELTSNQAVAAELASGADATASASTAAAGTGAAANAQPELAGAEPSDADIDPFNFDPDDVPEFPEFEETHGAGQHG
jgi:hypothetical protein